jgi:DNA-binding Lrp family transcriptional regulator
VTELDELDLRIVAQLHGDGRKPSTEIASALGMPRTTVARRLDRLVREKVITIGVFANGPKITPSRATWGARFVKGSRSARWRWHASRTRSCLG